MKPSCVLFIPVSSPSGIGEYMRSLIIAQALIQRWPDIAIHFILNEHVNYIKDCPHTVHTCKGSPTKDEQGVNRIIEEVNPDLVLFDASGRASQFKQAKRIGAKVAFISQHNKKRARGLKLNRIFFTDIHWVAQPDYCIKALGNWQKIKLTLFNKQVPQNIGPVFELSTAEHQKQLLNKFSLTAQQYFIFNAGSGGHLLSAQLAADIYYQAAQNFYRKTNIKCLVIFGSNYPKILPNKNALDNLENNGVISINNIDNKGFIALVCAAKGCVVSAGDTLLQCIALHKPCVAAPVSPDQPARLKSCHDNHLVLKAEATSESLVEQALRLIDLTDQGSQGIVQNTSLQPAINGLEIIVNDITALFINEDDTRQSHPGKKSNKEETVI